MGARRLSQMGKYELIPGSGIWVPDAGELVKGAAAGATGTTAAALAQSEGVKQAAISTAGEALGVKIIRYAPYIAGAVVAGLALYYFTSKK